MPVSQNSLILKSAIIVLVCGLLLTGCVPGGGRFNPNPWAGPVVSDDTLYVVSKDQGKLLALNLADNRNVLWKFAPKPEYVGGGFGCSSSSSRELLVYGNPAVNGEMVYIASHDGIVYAINSGSASREYSLLLEYVEIDKKHKAAITDADKDLDDIVDLGMITKDQGEQMEKRLGIEDSLIGQLEKLDDAIEFNILTAEKAKEIREYVTVRGIRWSYETDDDILAGLVISDDVIVVASGSELHALNKNKGVLKWFEPFKADGDIWGTPAINEGTVYFGTLEHTLYAVDLESGDEVWKREFGGAVASTPLIVEDTLYIGTFENRFYALDASSGEAKWDQPFEAENWFYTTPVYSDGTVYVGNLDHSVYAIEAATGKAKWNKPVGTGGAIRAALLIVDDTLLVASKDGFVYRLDPESGIYKLPRFTLEKKILADPFVSGNTVYVLNHKDKLFEFDININIRNENLGPDGTSLDYFNP